MKIYYLHIEGDTTPLYIGSTNQELKIRRENHLSDQRGDTPIKKWIREIKSRNDSKKLQIKEIEDCTELNRWEREAFWTLHYKPKLNTKVGVHHSEEHKKRVSNWMTNLKISDETRNKMCRSKKILYVPVIINGIKYASITYASLKTKISAGLICSVLKGNRNSKKYIITHG